MGLKNWESEIRPAEEREQEEEAGRVGDIYEQSRGEEQCSNSSQTRPQEKQELQAGWANGSWPEIPASRRAQGVDSEVLRVEKREGHHFARDSQGSESTDALA